MSVLVSLITHDGNAKYLGEVLSNIENMTGDFDLKIYSFNTEKKIVGMDLNLTTFDRPDFDDGGNDGRVNHFTGMGREELSQLVYLRNKILDAGLEGGYSHQLLVDSDVLLKKETLNKLLSYNKDIVGGWYFNKRFPDPAVQAIPSNKYIDEFMKEKKPFRAKVIGAGCLMLSRNVIESGIKFPYKTLWGEDWNFATNLIDAGFEIWCDAGLYCKHLGEFKPEADEYRKKKIKEWEL